MAPVAPTPCLNCAARRRACALHCRMYRPPCVYPAYFCDCFRLLAEKMRPPLPLRSHPWV